MIARIVELHIDPHHLDKASQLLEVVAPKVRAMPGCTGLEILSDVRDPSHITTYSYWKAEEDLNTYRRSATFIDFWNQIKPLFAKPARAWSSSFLFRL
jgi:quinol monooxygenase YgiN